MSNYQTKAFHPETGQIEIVNMLDDHFGRHVYGVQFSDGIVRRADGVVFACGHGNPAHECNACMVESDFAYDASREDRMFGR